MQALDGDFSLATPTEFADASHFGGVSGYGPGWRRMAARQQQTSTSSFIAQDSGTTFAIGDRVFHQKFGMGNVIDVDGDKLEIAFDRAGHKNVVSGFVTKP